MKLTGMTIEEMCFTTEKQMFDRKSAEIKATAIVIPMIAFSNTDGGLIAVGIEDDGKITGIDSFTDNINEILRAGYDFCEPTIFVEKEYVNCTDYKGNSNHILLIKIDQSPYIHVSHKDEVYIRVGDKSKKLSFEERMELMYAKGIRFYEDEPVYRSTLDDIDMKFVAEYCKKIGYGKSPMEYLTENKNYVVSTGNRQEMSGAAIMMFGKNPQEFFPRSRVRFIRYEGNEEKVGAQMNVIKDVTFEGRILELVEKTIEYVATQIKEHTYLGADARFVTEPEYPEFVWKEIIINAIAHRDYAIKGTDIQIKMFDDHIAVESPGTLPGTVRINNMRKIHFSRNPKMAQLLHEYEYVREFGEGIDRMYREMEEAGLPEPEYKTVAFMLRATIKNKNALKSAESAEDVPKSAEDVPKSAEDVVVAGQKKIVYEYVLRNGFVTSAIVCELLNIKERRARKILSEMCGANIIKKQGATSNLKYVIVV